ncbi:MAG: DUF3820 family protein [Verrucomicrobiota bacterium]|nr:DUF3820 family protein [Verrucomicrobiota bacterium]
MKLLKDEIFVCIDCESTGLEPKKDRIIEIAVASFTLDQVVESFESLIDPECAIPQESQKIHGITAEMVCGKPKIAEVLPQVLEIAKGKIWVGHGIDFDRALILAEAKRYAIPCSFEDQPFVDTLRMARLYGESPVNSLQQLRRHFNIAAEGAHRAMGDVLVNIEVFKHLVKSYQTTKELLNLLQKPIRMRTMPLGKYKGRKFDEIPMEYLLWAEKKDFDQDLLYSLRLEIRSRKKGGNFSQAGNPFNNL